MPVQIGNIQSTVDARTPTGDLEQQVRELTQRLRALEGETAERRSPEGLLAEVWPEGRLWQGNKIPASNAN